MTDSTRLDANADTRPPIPSSGALFHEAFNDFSSGMKGLVSLGKASLSFDEALILKSIEIDNSCRQFEINAARAIGHTLGNAALATGKVIKNAGHELAAENPELGQDIASAKRHIGETVKAAKTGIETAYNNDKAFVATRPATAIAEAAIAGPIILAIDGAHRGGLPKDNAARADSAKTAGDRPAADASTPTTAPIAASKAEASHPADSQNQAEIIVNVHAGDGYWQVAQRALGKGASQAEILQTSKFLQESNQNKMLHPGDVIKMA